MRFNIKDLQTIFHQTFLSSYSTKLVYGADEPFYETAKQDDDFHKLICRSDFFASALHEISHWCIAGTERRKRDDFGYWYNPDGRSLEEQKQFEKFEIKPQALEMAFSKSCNYPFKVSVDNLSLPDYDCSEFEDNVYQQMRLFQKNGFPKRAQMFIDALSDFYQSKK